MSENQPQEKTFETRLKEMEAIVLHSSDTIKRLEPLADLVEKVDSEEGGIEAAAVGSRTKYWGEHQGNLMGAEMVSHYQRNAPKFAEAVSRTVATYANELGGMMDAEAVINGKKYNWIKPLIYLGIPAVVVLLVFSNPAVSIGFSDWASRGINAYIVLVFLAAILVLVFLIVNRKRPEQVS